MPRGKPGEILCAVCRKRLRATDETAKIEKTCSPSWSGSGPR